MNPNLLLISLITITTCFHDLHSAESSLHTKFIQLSNACKKCEHITPQLRLKAEDFCKQLQTAAAQHVSTRVRTKLIPLLSNDKSNKYCLSTIEGVQSITDYINKSLSIYLTKFFAASAAKARQDDPTFPPCRLAAHIFDHRVVLWIRIGMSTLKDNPYYFIPEMERK